MDLRKRFVAFFNSNSIEENIILIICAFGLLRSMIGIATDWNLSVLLLRNIIFVFLFSTFLGLMIWRKDHEWVKILFGIVFIILMSLNFIQTGSLQDMGKFNAMGSLILLVVMYRGFWMYAMPLAFFLIVGGLTLYPEAFRFTGLDIIQLNEGFRDDINFWVSCIGISSVVYYMKFNYDIRQNKLGSVTELLAESNELLLNQKTKLVQNRLELEQANQLLNSKIEKRTNELLSRNHALNVYVELNTKEILTPLQETISMINEIEDTVVEAENTELIELLRKSGNELDTVHNVISNSLIKDGSIKRKDIKG